MTATDTTLAGLDLVPALVNGIFVPVACPTRWCTEDHAGEDARHLDDIDHSGAHVDVMVPRLQGGDELFAYAHLQQDTYSTDPLLRAPHIHVEDGGGEESYLTPEQAVVFADRLVEFADRLRGLAGVAHGEPEGVDVAEVAFAAGLDAIEAALKSSTDLPQTRKALRNAVDLYADEVRG